ncbi:hypothetical protein [Sulfurovum sp. NBC37-1]|uniref:hypothetical protein n=1 Tax=Sulfurovum sp. (strain NBC37-1) TaxID=387093 RepID=UPI00015876D5|nr:hypothetical protein [Sulfurovum sp. NBC37-1]BAF71584.1 hypothetical protein SUN_0625 [Sulfurovum sp. NBC37-1]
MIDFNNAMKRLRVVNGYLGSAVLNYSGETLYIDNENTGTDIPYSASIFNDAYRMISESSLDVGFSEASSIEAKTLDGHVFLINSAGLLSDDNFAKINVFAIFRDDGNVALAKMIMDKSAKNMSEELAKM